VPSDVAQLVVEAMPLLDTLASWMSRRLGGDVSVMDLRAYGNAVLLEATRTFDPTRAKFSTYIAKRIKWAMIDGLRQETKRRRVLLRARALAGSERYGERMNAAAANAPGPATEEFYHGRLRDLLDGHAAALAMGLIAAPLDVADAYETPEDQTARAELSRTLREAVRQLPERERILIERHYYRGEAFDAIARDIGISKSWASRLHAQAVQALAKALKDSARSRSP
jgi:RNA polymerase sigma factor for flagellar operon FliA